MLGKRSLLILSVLVVGSISLLAKDKPVSFTGWVSDEHCGALHTKRGGGDCVRKCIKGGQEAGHPEWKPQRVVIVSDGDNKIWFVTNPGVLRGLEGEHVRVMGRMDGEKNSLHVASAVTFLGEDEKQ